MPEVTYRVTSFFKAEDDLRPFLRFDTTGRSNGPIYHDESANEEDIDEACSINSVSTNATADDIPGPGRIIDKCIYQYFGRKIERFANRLSISFLSPNRIEQCLSISGHSFPLSRDAYPLGFVMKEIAQLPYLPIEPGACVAGLKSLVNQTKSNSLYRSAAAMACLLRLSTTSYVYDSFFRSVAVVEPIFHLETLAKALRDSHPEKIYYLLLLNLARSQLALFRGPEQSKPPSVLASSLRKNLLRMLESCQSLDHNPFIVIGNACHLLATTAYPVYYYIRDAIEDSPAHQSIMESTYFLVIFLIRSLLAQYYRITSANSNTQDIRALVLTTYIHWFQNVMLSFTSDSFGLRTDRPRYMCALPSAFIAIGDTHTKLFFPRLINRYKSMPLIDPAILPRRVRAINSHTNEFSMLHSYSNTWIRRSRRLLASLDELEREIRDSSASFGHAISRSGGSMCDEISAESKMQDSLQRAQQVTVHENNKTREFLRARDERKGDERDKLRRWTRYKKICRLRHRWGELLRSNTEWDWDTAVSLKRLFRIEGEGNPRSGTRRCTSNFERSSSHRLVVSIEEPQSNLPEVIQLRYKTKTGEIAFKTFYAGSSVQDLSSVSESLETPTLQSFVVEASRTRVVICGDRAVVREDQTIDSNSR